MDGRSNRQVIIIGAGASGLMAAVSAAEQGAGVLVLEHMEDPGKKLLLTGNGRCNYTNTGVGPEHYHSLQAEAPEDAALPDKMPRTFEEWIGEILGQFDSRECLEYFEELGIAPDIRHYRFDENGYVYPAEGGAGRVLEALLARAALLGVRICCGARILNIGPDRVSYCIREKGHTMQQEAPYDALILATGSNACPSTGSDNSIYPFLKEADLGFTPFYPALCALYSKSPLLAKLKGRRMDCNVFLEIGGGEDEAAFSQRYYGEVQFNEHSISGIPVMQLAGPASPALKEGRTVTLHILPDGRDALEGQDALAFPIHRTAGFERAQCCAGGVAWHTVSPRTMASLRRRGVYLCGELMDVYGDCGGYNLHFAWASGRIAGICAGRGQV